MQLAHRFPRLLGIIAASAVWASAMNPVVFAQNPEIPDLFGQIGAGQAEAKASGPQVDISLLPADAQPGDEVTLSIAVKVPADGYTYSTSPAFSGGTRIKIKAAIGLEPAGEDFQPDHSPKTVFEPAFKKNVEKHLKDVTWSRKYRILADAEPGQVIVTGTFRYQICDKRSCVPYRVPIEIALAGPVEKTDAENDSEVAELGGSERPKGLIPFLVGAMTAGFLALLTPCVFPMVPITVSFFLKQAEKEHHRPFSTALVYCLGIVVTFTVLGLLMAAVFGASSLNELSNNPWLNLAIAGVLVFFGMNLLGLFEIRVPGWLLTWSSLKEGRGGIVGTLFMSFTFTLVSFTCTFAFAGLLLVWAANGEYYWPILGMVAFSSAFSFPFFFLAIFPSYLHKLPKSGGWMNRVKVTMGMIECGAAFKFLSVADLSWNPVPMMFDYAMVMSAWMVLAICTGLYLLGMFRTPHDTPSDSVGVLRLGTAMTFLGLAAYLAVGLFAAEKPTGSIWKQILAFAPPQFEAGDGDLGPFLEHDGLKFALNYDLAVDYAKQKDVPLFLDFTGVNCVNCRLMEDRMSMPHNRDELQKFVLVQLYTDNVPSIRDEELVEELLEKNRDLQENWFGDVTLPSYAVVTPDGKKLLATFKGLEQQEGEFAEFLRAGHEKWERLHAGKSRLAHRD